jgi:hypothetical protein
LFIRITVIEGPIIVIVIGIFVDDSLVIGNSVAVIKAVRDRMNERFILTDQGQLEYCLVEISKLDENTLLFHQTAYVKKILNHFNMSE